MTSTSVPYDFAFFVAGPTITERVRVLFVTKEGYIAPLGLKKYIYMIFLSFLATSTTF